MWYDTFQLQNIEWLLLVNDVLCDCFGFSPSYVAGILNVVKEIHFYVLFSKSYVTVNILEMYHSKTVHYHLQNTVFLVVKSVTL